MGTLLSWDYFAGIYEIFCKETFGVKAKNLEFGLQPYKIPETETVRCLAPHIPVVMSPSGGAHSCVVALRFAT